MSKKKLVALIFGGESAEHEVSIRSARNIFAALSPARYETLLIGIDRRGTWHRVAKESFIGAGEPVMNEPVACVPLHGRGVILSVSDGAPIASPDVAFPILHGTFGEDGTVQGLLKLAHIPFVGPSVLGSAAGMDKDVTKRLLRDSGIPIPKFIALQRHERDSLSYEQVSATLSATVFVKPANLGSSVGVSRASDAASFSRAIELAFQFDSKIMIEEAITGREVECSVLGNEHPQASLPGEIAPTHEFYSYEAKYLDDNGARLQIPAKLPEDQTRRIRELAVKTFKVLCCEGLSRVDFFLTPNGEVLVNEINTLPGFTNISMYPKMWEATGIPYEALLDQLLTLAEQRFQREASLKTSR